MRKHVVYAGRVQGVGFRATCLQISRAFAVTGWVRNLADGDVELQAEGPVDEVNAFLTAIHERLGRNIASARVDDITLANDEMFEIRF